MRLLIARADRADPPAAITRPTGGGMQRRALAIDFNPSRVVTVLSQAGVVHESARPDPVREARLLDRKRPAGKVQIGLHTLAIDGDAKLLEWLDNLDPDRADLQVHPLHPQLARGVEVVLDPIADHRKMRVGNIEVGIDAKCHREKARAIGGIAIEEIAIIEIAVGPRIGNRLGRLMQRKIIAFGQHASSPFAKRRVHHGRAPAHRHHEPSIGNSRPREASARQRRR